MNPVFEAKYIAIKWYDKNTVLKIDEAVLPISIEVENDLIYNMELQTYTRIENGLDGQIAFKILDDNIKIEPYFIDASNNKIPLLKIQYNNKTWWIENGNWSKQYKYRSSPLWNNIGDTKVIFGDITCNINVRASSFTKEQLNLYLKDFKNDFWYLILKNDSITQGDAKNKKVKLLNKNTVRFISEFIRYTANVLKNPKKELREIQQFKDIKKVKPVARTFMEIATKGFQKRLTSRDTVESYNISENKYIHYMLQQVYTIVLHMAQASGHIENIYKKRYEYDTERLNSFTDKKIIDKEVYENEIQNLKIKVNQEKENLINCIDLQDKNIKEELQNQIDQQTRIHNQIYNALNTQQRVNREDLPTEFIIKLDNRQQDYGNTIQFWGKIRRNDAQDWDHFEVNNWLSLGFNNQIFNFLEPNQEYSITAYYSYTKAQTQRGNIHKIFFSYITKLEPLYQQNKIEYKTIVIKFSTHTSYNNLMQFKGQTQLPNGQYFNFNNNDFYSFEFDKKIFENVIFQYQTYKITAYIESKKQNWANKIGNGVIHKRYFKYITKIELLSKSRVLNTLDKLESQRLSLEATNWQRILNTQERQEQEYEKVALKKSLNSIKENYNDTSDLMYSLKPKLEKLKHLLEQCKNLKIEKDSYFPNSMTFVQNPNYQGSHRYYTEIKKIIGIDENLFMQLQFVEKIGLLDIPTIYERWCLLQIIKVLIEKYRFTPLDNWKQSLANQIIGNINKIRDVKISFLNEEIKRRIDLLYEYELPSKKRPDFILNIKSTRDTNDTYTHKLIMDAKFHEEVIIEDQIDLLYNKKNYSENNKNSVFILHPDTNKSIKIKRTPKKWGNDAYYGETEMFNFDWDKDRNPNHKYGAILLSPILNDGSFLDNLQRLIGMCMQYKLEINSNIKTENGIIDPMPKEKIFCLVCGHDKYKIEKHPTRNGSKYWITCLECQHKTIYNYCGTCKTRLIKNGDYWTYHSTPPLEFINIKCPSCGDLL